MGLRFPISSPPSGVRVPNDQTFAYDSSGTLHGVILGSDNIYQGSTTNPNNDGHNGRPASSWTYTTSPNTSGYINQQGRGTANQPWSAVGSGKVVAAYDNFNSSFNKVEERISVSTNNGASFPTDIPISAGGQVSTSSTNPGTRIAMDANGNVYSIFGIGTSKGANGSNVTYRLNEYTGGNSALYTNSTSGPGGLLVANGTSKQFGYSFANVNQQQGNMTAIATDKSGSNVYVAYGAQDANGKDRIYLADFTNNQGTLIERANPVAVSVAGQEAVMPSIAVTDKGTVFVEYDSAADSNPIGSTGNPEPIHVHLASSSNDGLTFADSNAANGFYTFTAPGKPGSAGFSDTTRTLGDYQFLTALGDTVYGTFAGTGDTNAGGITTTSYIDPFFFTASDASPAPEPAQVATLSMIGLGLAGLLLSARKRKAQSAE